MITKEELQRLYLDDKVSIKDFNEKYNIPTATLYRYLKKYNIPKNRSLDIPKETLYDLYITQDLTLDQIGVMYNSNHHSVSALCTKYGIVKEYINKDELKELLQTHKTYSKVANILKEKYNKPFTTNTIAKYAKLYGYDIYTQTEYNTYNNPDTIEAIKQLAENELLSIREISKKLSISRIIVAQLIKENNIQALHTKGLNIYTRNIPLDNVNILHSKELLEQYIKENNIVSPNDLGVKLNINGNTAYTYCFKYNIMHLFPKQSSQPEKEVLEYINQHYVTENNTRKYLDGKEIDIYIPVLNIGIEFNGDYWHCDKFVSEKYHQDKSLLGESKGIFIYHIFEHEWNSKKELIISQLNNLLGINQVIIQSNECIVKEVDDKDKSLFLETNHLQGDSKSSINLGLYYNNELVSIMTFDKLNDNEYELNRLCSKIGTNIVGGINKLWDYFIDKYKPLSIISYSDIAKSKGDLYTSLGFNLDSITNPTYHLFSHYKIYDCGNKLWVYNKRS